MARCAGFKRSGERCTLEVSGQQSYCWAHDPANAEQRKKRASRGGKAKANRAIKDLHSLLEDLTDRVVDGTLETSRGAVAAQLVNTRIRLFELERRLREQQELEERISALEAKAEPLRQRRY
jgi:hypothetical protein